MEPDLSSSPAGDCLQLERPDIEVPHYLISDHMVTLHCIDMETKAQKAQSLI